jgi:MSHA pilin protein MshD
MYPRRPVAFTAFETLIAIAILAVVTAALSGALSAGRQQTKNAQNTVAATELAQALMDEILRLPYSDPNGYTTFGPDPGETSRALFNNIDDYHGYTDGPANATDVANNPYPSNLQGFIRSVTVTTATMQPSGWTMTVSGELVQVTVTLGGTTIVTLQRFVPAS